MRDRRAKWTDEPGWLKWAWVLWLRNPYVQLRLGAVTVIVTLLIWTPIRFWLAAHGMNAAEEVIFHLSMLAILVGGVNLVVTTDVGETVKD